MLNVRQIPTGKLKLLIIIYKEYDFNGINTEFFVVLPLKHEGNPDHFYLRV